MSRTHFFHAQGANGRVLLLDNWLTKL